MLNIEKISKNFQGVKAVDNCSIKIEKGKITALIGPNGSGKTTIINLISGVIKPDYGKIIFENNNLSGLSIEKIANLGISRLFQQSRLFDNLSIKDNLLIAVNNNSSLIDNILGLNKIAKEIDAKIKTVYDMMEIKESWDKLVSELSYGQKRLVEIAQTILLPHKLLLLDEPVAGVTSLLRKRIAKILLELKQKGETILFIEHDMSFTLDIADDIIVMDAGKIIARGKPENVIKDKKVLEAYLG